MMTDYISRGAALTALQDSDLFNTTERQLRAIRELPDADVAEVVHGKWENGNPICPVCGGNKFKDLDADIWCDWQPDFCPNCGARMDGGNDDAVY